MQSETYLSAASTNICPSCFSRIHVTTLQTQMHCRGLHGKEPLLCFDHVLRICTTRMVKLSYTINIYRTFTKDITDRFLRLTTMVLKRNTFCSERTHKLHVGSLFKKKKSENLEWKVGSIVFYKNHSQKYICCNSLSQSSLTR